MKSLLFHVRGCLTAAVALLVLAGAAHAIPFDIFNTGVDGGNVLLPNGAISGGKYTLVLVPGGTTTVRVATTGTANAAWLNSVADDLISSWIGPDATGLQGPPGDYDYQTTFDLSGFDPTTAKITLRWAADNSGSKILLNNASIGDPTVGFSAWSPTYTISSGFIAGVNTLDFFVHNGGTGNNPTGLRVEMLSSDATATPEPASLFLIGVGLVALGIFRRRGV